MKHVTSYLFGTLIFSLLLAGPASAQVASGLNELGGRGSIETGKYVDQDDNEMLLELNMFYGRFVTDHVEIGPAININKYASEDATGAVGGFASYYFGDTSKRMIPYVEGAAGKFLNGGDDKPTYLAIGPGMKWFFGDGGGALNVGAFYRRQFLDADLHGGTSAINEFALQVGVSVFFGR